MNSEIVKLLKTLPSPRILILGDIMLDHFLWGSVQRISPEAPTPVLAYRDDDFQLGGAGFTATVLKQLGAEVEILALSGDDPWRQTLLDLLEKEDINADQLIADASRPTIRKVRMQARDSHLPSGSQQLLRLDYEDTTPLSAEMEALVIKSIKEAAGRAEAILVSDYNKGFLTENVLATLSEIALEKPVIGDPGKGRDFQLYQNFTAIKPNRYEAESFVGYELRDRESIRQAGAEIIAKANLEYVIISLDSDGLFYAHKNGKQLFVPTKKMEVFDVAGAGDSIISILTLLANEKISSRYMLEVANIAAGIMISQQQPKSISRNDIVHQLVLGDDPINRKIKSLDELKITLQTRENSEKKIFFTNGYFDNITPMQIKFLEKLSAYEGIRIVAINSDASIAAQGNSAILGELDRLRLLQLFDCIDYIVIFDESDAGQLLKALRPDFFLKGRNYEGQEISEKAILDEIGCQLEFVSID